MLSNGDMSEKSQAEFVRAGKYSSSPLLLGWESILFGNSEGKVPVTFLYSNFCICILLAQYWRRDGHWSNCEGTYGLTLI